ncbi:universal stress protein [Filimonas effusa]|uniref:Universal stress protein n=1 Tax=Filimonas effusa TaxID=2508721 RepID=A0A4Q1D996_9BACT|nr:universal stress protein [Filimonas effusa]RXK85942.1 universal stress protein [Filimonas effusa]
MIPTILVITNISPSSQNALNYTCQLFQNQQARIIVLRIFALTSGFAGDGLAMAAMAETVASHEKWLEIEKASVMEAFPGLDIETRMVAGTFDETLREQIALENAAAVVFGEEGDHNALLSWDNYVLNAFIDLPVPVLLVPAGARFKTVSHIAFACNYKRENLHGPVDTLKKMMTRLNCQLHFVHVTPENKGLSAEEQTWKQRWQNELHEYPVYFDELEDNDVVTALDRFCESREVDLLAIRPHRAGIWASIFDKSQTREIVNLNKLPVLALRSTP